MQKILFVPDCHFPYADNKAWKLLLKVARELKPDTIVVLGDFADFYSVSSHDKSPNRATTLMDELPAVHKALDELDSLGAKTKLFIEGNHEFRLARHLSSNSPALVGLPNLTVPGLLKLKTRKWKFFPYRTTAKIGKLNITHDVGYAGKNAVFQNGAAFESNVVCGHTHRMAVHYFGNHTGTCHVSASFGWLGSKRAVDYMHGTQINRDWRLGFGLGYLQDNGVVHIQAIPIIDYSCVVNGKLHESRLP